MKRMLKGIIIFCIVLCGVMIGEYVEAEPALGWGLEEFGMSSQGPFYGSKEELLEHIPENSGGVNEVYVRLIVTSMLDDNWKSLGQSNPKIIKVSGGKYISMTEYTQNCSEKDYAIAAIFGPVGASTPGDQKKVKVEASYDENSKTNKYEIEFTLDQADSFDGGSSCQPTGGNAPECEIKFKLGPGSEGDSNKEVVVGSGKVLYRYNQKIEVVFTAKDDGANDIGIAKMNTTSNVGTSSVTVNNEKSKSKTETVCNSWDSQNGADPGDYEVANNSLFSMSVEDGAGKTANLSGIKLSDYIKKYHTVTAQEAPIDEFKAYVKDNRVVVKIKIKYGEEFLKGISSSESNSGDGYMDKETATLVGSDPGVNGAYKTLVLHTKNKPTDPAKIYLCYEKNDGTTGYKEVSYTIDGALKEGYQYDSDLQKFDISKGNLLIDKNNIAHYGKVLSGVETDESTVTCKDKIMITGITDKYTVKIEKAGKTIVLANGLSVTGNAEVIDIEGSANLEIKSGSTVTLTSTSGNAIKASGGTLTIYGGGTLSATTNSSSKAAIAGSDINIYSLSKLKTKSSDGAGVGCDLGGSCGNIKIVNCGLDINTTGGGAGIGSGKNGSVGSVEVKGAGSSQKIVSLSGACIGSGSGGSVNGDIVIEKIHADLEADLGSAIGTGSGGRCNSIRVDYSKLDLKSNNTAIGASGSGGQCGVVTILRSDVKISSCKVGIGSTGSSCSDITVQNGVEIDIKSSEVGIGVATGGMGNININTGVVELRIKATKVGIGSTTDTSGSNITIKNNYGIEINDAFVGIGSNSKIGNISVQDTGKILIKKSLGGEVGIGATDKVGNITCKTKATISGYKIGVGGISEVGNIDMSDCTEILIKATDVCIGGKGKVGGVKISGSKMQLGDSGNKCQIGVGKLGSGDSMGEVEIKSGSDVKMYASKIGIGNENSGSSSIKITGSKVDISGVSDIGIGTNGQCGGITIDSSSKVRINSGAKVGIGAVGTCGDISISGSDVQVGSNDSKCTVGIGTTVGGSGNISISSGGMSIYAEVGIGSRSSNTSSLKVTIKDGANVKVDGCTVGIGAGGGGKIGNIELKGVSLDITPVSDGVGIGGGGIVGTITISNGSKAQVSSGKVGIGAGSGTVGNISLNASKVNMSSVAVGIGANGGAIGNIVLNNNSYAEISASLVGIGATSSNENSAIRIESGGVKIQGAVVGIGANGGSVGNVEIGNNTIVINTSSGGIGVGGKGGAVGGIKLEGSSIEVSDAGIGIGSSGAMGDIVITGCDIVRLGASDVGIGTIASNSGKKINISNSGVYVGNASVCIGSRAEMGDIIIGSSRVKVNPNSGGIGIGSTSYVGWINIVGSNIEVGSTASVGIGVSGGAQMGNIKIEGGTVKVCFTNGIGIGSIGRNLGKTITLDRCGVNVSGTGVGIGAIGAIGNVNIEACDNVNVVATTTCIGCSDGGTCEDINITNAGVYAEISSEEGCGIGGEGTIGNININNSKVQTKTGNGCGIGNSLSTQVYEDITIENSELDITVTGSGTGIGCGSGRIDTIDVGGCAIKIRGGSGFGAGIGCGSGIVGKIKLYNNVISVHKESSSKGAGIGSGQGGDAGNINLTKNKIVVASGNGAGIGSGSGGQVSGTITIDDGVIIARGVNGCAIGSGNGGSVGYIHIKDGKIYAKTTGSGSGIGGNVSSTLEIDTGDILCNATGGGSGMSAIGGSILIHDGKIYTRSNNGNALGDASGITIEKGDIEAVANGACGISGGEITINSGVVKAKGGNWDINGSTIKISMNANVQAYNNKTTVVQRKEDGSTVTQKKLHTDFWRDNPGTAKINGGDYNVRTDSSGDVYFWTKANETGLTFDLHGKLMVI